MRKRIDQHFLDCHMDKPEVSRIDAVQNDRQYRRSLFAALRLRGNDFYNKSRFHNPEGNLLVVRRVSSKPSTSKKNKKQNEIVKCTELVNNAESDLQNEKSIDSANTTESNFQDITKKSQQVVMNKDSGHIKKVRCKHCSGFFSSKSIHNHIRSKHPEFQDDYSKSRGNLRLSKSKTGQCNKRATEVVKNKILPKLSWDCFGIIARNDDLIILYGNKFAEKYNIDKQGNYIRGHMRLLAKLALEIRKINNSIFDLMAAFKPEHWPTFLQAIMNVCRFDPDKKIFECPYNGETLPILVRKCFKILMHEFIVKLNDSVRKQLDDFKYVFEHEIEARISAIATRSRLYVNRNKPTEILPRQDDIAKLKTFVELKREETSKLFESEFPATVEFN